MALFIGLMSGTSIDGVDGVLADWDESALPRAVLAHVHEAMPPKWRGELLALNASGANELHRAALAANALVDVYARTVTRLLAASGRSAREVRAIGAHGQTVRHRPGAFDGTGYSLQLMNGALLAERTGIDTVCDFRSADVAAGGQGAPLVPAFHAGCFRRTGQTVAVLNIGGIANLTVLHADGGLAGFDCGPGNVLMDAWVQRHRSLPFDQDGRWAASGQVRADLLAGLSAEPYFALPPPKSTGRDLFNLPWLDDRLGRPGAAAFEPADVMATLAELTVAAASDALRAHAPACRELLVCGGGAANATLMQRLAARLPEVEVRSTASAGLPPEQVEALAFGWLAARRIRAQTGNVPAVTGASGERILGALYLAPPLAAG